MRSLQVKAAGAEYPISMDVSFPRLFCTEPFHCWTYCAGAWGSNAVKLTVVAGSGPVTQNRSAKIHPGRKERGRRSEIVRLLCFRKYKRYIVPLVAPGILVHRACRRFHKTA